MLDKLFKLILDEYGNLALGGVEYGNNKTA